MFNKFFSMALTAFSVLIAGALIYSASLKLPIDFQSNESNEKNESAFDIQALEEKIIPLNGVELPVKWGNLGKQLIESKTIDAKKFEEIYSGRGGLSEENKKLLYRESNGNLVINRKNSGIILNLLWALGLGNKNEILDKGPMTDPQYGGAGRFASTGGWTIADGDPEGASAMNHYSRHQFIILTEEQQALVEKVSKNIYRPCCGNSTYFPDCNHGMAMLGLLELAASQGIGENELYKIALIVNSYWFPDTYLTIARYFENQRIGWDKIDAQKVLGFDFSSASGYQKILSQVGSLKNSNGGSCGV